MNVSESEAKAAENIPAASADDHQEPREEEERVATPPVTQEVVLEENMNVTDPLARQAEVENLEATTTNTNEATDVVMAEANVTPKANAAPEANLQPEVNATATAPVPPLDLHSFTISLSFRFFSSRGFL